MENKCPWGNFSPLNRLDGKLQSLLCHKWLNSYQVMSHRQFLESTDFLGINAVFFYTNKIFSAAGFSEETSTMISALVGVENVIMTFVSMILMDKMGRKSLQVYGYAIMTFL